MIPWDIMVADGSASYYCRLDMLSRIYEFNLMSSIMNHESQFFSI